MAEDISPKENKYATVLSDDNWIEKIKSVKNGDNASQFVLMKEFMETHPKAVENLKRVTFTDDNMDTQYQFNCLNPHTSDIHVVNVEWKGYEGDTYLLLLQDSKFNFHVLGFVFTTSALGRIYGELEHCQGAHCGRKMTTFNDGYCDGCKYGYEIDKADFDETIDMYDSYPDFLPANFFNIKFDVNFILKFDT